jgi:2-oxoglutarate ferredoxin oxidoreductase subunit alpha
MGNRVLTGKHIMMSNEAMVEGAIAAGCNFYAGYPITPQNEVLERMSERMPQVGRVFIQMEDEMASIGACYGAAIAGHKVMTSTSGPGFCLMQEFISLAAYNEVPIVIANVGRVSPGTGVVSLPHMGDIMQARFGGNGDYEIIAIAPSSAQESFDFTIMAFNLAETWRVPTIILSDAMHGHMREKVIIPTQEEIDQRVVKRRNPTDEEKSREEFFTREENGKFIIPAMPTLGTDYYPLWYSTIMHNKMSLPILDSESAFSEVKCLCEKITKNEDKICQVAEYYLDDAEIAVIAYGLPFRSALRAVQESRSLGIKVGLLRLITVWPFAQAAVTKVAKRVKHVIVPEINLGQLFIEIERAVVKCNAQAHLVPQIGKLHEPHTILNKIKEVL